MGIKLTRATTYPIVSTHNNHLATKDLHIHTTPKHLEICLSCSVPVGCRGTPDQVCRASSVVASPSTVVGSCEALLAAPRSDQTSHNRGVYTFERYKECRLIPKNAYHIVTNIFFSVYWQRCMMRTCTGTCTACFFVFFLGTLQLIIFFPSFADLGLQNVPHGRICVHIAWSHGEATRAIVCTKVYGCRETICVRYDRSFHVTFVILAIEKPKVYHPIPCTLGENINASIVWAHACMATICVGARPSSQSFSSRILRTVGLAKIARNRRPACTLTKIKST